MDAFTRRVFGLARVAAFALLLLLPGKADAAPWYEHYALAEDAMKAENWSEAVVQLNEAIQRRGDSGAHIRSYGMKVISYFPYLKLGIAHHELGDYEAALHAQLTGHAEVARCPDLVFLLGLDDVAVEVPLAALEDRGHEQLVGRVSSHVLPPLDPLDWLGSLVWG